MNKILIAAVALATFGSVAAQAADGRDTSLNQPTQVQVIEGRNAVALPTVSDAYIKATVEQNARSSH